MTDTLHKDITGADLHEPKGIATATSGQVYKADGAGSGVWQSLVVPTGLFNITVTEFISGGTWTKPAGCFMIKVTVIGGGGGSGGFGGTGGTSSFGSYCSATGGGAGSGVGTGAGGSGTGGDINHDGETAASSNFSAFMRAQSGVRFGQFGLGSLGNGTDTSGGGAGGTSIKYIYSVPATATVTVGAAGAGARTGLPGVVLVEQYLSV